MAFKIVTYDIGKFIDLYLAPSTTILWGGRGAKSPTIPKST